MAEQRAYKTRWIPSGDGRSFYCMLVPEPLTPADYARMFDPIENAKAAARRYMETRGK